MKIQKLVARIFFAAASLCWVGCNDNSVSPVVTPDTSSSVEPGSSSEPGSSAASSSSSEVRSSSSDERIPPMSATVYGIEPAFSSSSEETSSSSEEKPFTPNDSLGAALTAMGVCDAHNGIQSVGAYVESWTTPEQQGQSKAESDMLLKIQNMLKSDEAKLFSAEKIRCLEKMKLELDDMACMYGAPMPYEYDKWVANCSDGSVIMSPEYEAKILDNKIRSEKAHEEAAKELEDKLKKCDDPSAEL